MTAESRRGIVSGLCAFALVAALLPVIPGTAGAAAENGGSSFAEPVTDTAAETAPAEIEGAVSEAVWEPEIAAYADEPDEAAEVGTVEPTKLNPEDADFTWAVRYAGASGHTVVFSRWNTDGEIPTTWITNGEIRTMVGRPMNLTRDWNRTLFTISIQGNTTIYTSSLPWASEDGDTEVDSVVIDDSRGKITPDTGGNYAMWFSNMQITEISNLQGLHFPEGVDCTAMFYGTTELKEVSFEGCDLTEVTSIEAMFSKTGAERIEFPAGTTFNKAVSAKFAFSYAPNLAYIGCPDMQLDAVTIMQYAFAESPNITLYGTNYLENVTAPNCTSWDSTFLKSSKIHTLKMQNWQMGNVTNMSRTFSGCTSLNINEDDGSTMCANWDTSSVENFQQTFFGVQGSSRFEVPNWDTSSCEIFESMLRTSSFASVDISGWTMKDGADTSTMMIGCNNLYQVKMGPNVRFTSGSENTPLPVPDGTLLPADLPGTVDGKWYHETAMQGSGVWSKDLADLPELTGWWYAYHNRLDQFWVVYGTASGTVTDNLLVIGNWGSVNDIPASWEGKAKLGAVQMKLFPDEFIQGTSISRPTAINAYAPTFEKIVIWDENGPIVPIQAGGTSMGGWFYNFRNCKSIENAAGIDTSKVQNMKYMLQQSGLTSLDLSENDLEALTDLTGAFYNNAALKEIAFPTGSKLASLETASMLFYGCGALEHVWGSDCWEFSKDFSNMQGMFYNCSSLKEFSAPNWNTAKANASFLFYNCTSMTSAGDTSRWNFSGSTSFQSGFYNCSSLTSLDLSSAGFQGTQSMAYAFAGCSNLTEITGTENWQFISLRNAAQMFNQCGNLENLYFAKNADMAAVEDMNFAFFDCKKLQTLGDTSGWRLHSVKNMNTAFGNCNSLQDLVMDDWGMENCEDLYQSFWGVYGLTEPADISKWDVSKVKRFTSAFRGLAIANIDISGWDMSGADFTTYPNAVDTMFWACNAAVEIHLGPNNVFPSTAENVFNENPVYMTSSPNKDHIPRGAVADTLWYHDADPDKGATGAGILSDWRSSGGAADWYAWRTAKDWGIQWSQDGNTVRWVITASGKPFTSSEQFAHAIAQNGDGFTSFYVTAMNGWSGDKDPIVERPMPNGAIELTQENIEHYLFEPGILDFFVVFADADGNEITDLDIWKVEWLDDIDITVPLEIIAGYVQPDGTVWTPDNLPATGEMTASATWDGTVWSGKTELTSAVGFMSHVPMDAGSKITVMDQSAVTESGSVTSNLITAPKQLISNGDTVRSSISVKYDGSIDPSLVQLETENGVAKMVAGTLYGWVQKNVPQGLPQGQQVAWDQGQ